MGLQANNAQIGQSGTNSQNFNIRTALDGILRFSRGGKGVEISDPLKIEANNDVTTLGNLTLGGNLLSGAFGLGQTWQDVLASRSFGTTYTNTTGKPIGVHFGCNSTTSCVINVIVNGIQLIGVGIPTGLSVSSGVHIVPAGATYSVPTPAGTLSNQQWRELR